MGLIFKSGYLKVDPNGMIARIVFSNGNESQILATKRQALEIGEAMIDISITPEEWKIINQQIHASPLINRNKDLEDLSNNTASLKEDIIRMIGQFKKEQKRQSDEGEEWKL